MGTGASSATKSDATEAQALVSAALLILEKFPKLPDTDDDSSIKLNIGSSFTPFRMIAALLKQIGGFNLALEVVTSVLVLLLKPLEWAVKFNLIANIKNLLTCSLNPFITDDILRNGICFNLQSLDLFNQLSISPLDKKYGKYYYWGFWETTPKKTDDGKVVTNEKGEVQQSLLRNSITCSADMLKSDDLNVWLWYMKNKAMERVVWRAKNEGEDREVSKYLPFCTITKEDILPDSTHKGKALTDYDKVDAYLAEYMKSAKSEAKKDTRLIDRADDKATELYRQYSDCYERITDKYKTDPDWSGRATSNVDEAIGELTFSAALQDQDLNSAKLKRKIRRTADWLLDMYAENRVQATYAEKLSEFESRELNLLTMTAPELDKVIPALRKEVDDDKYAKMAKKDGIVTFAYYETPELVRNYCGNDAWLRLPCNNIIQVFVGNTRPSYPSHDEYAGSELEARIYEESEQIENCDEKITKANKSKSKLQKRQLKGEDVANQIEAVEQSIQDIQAERAELQSSVQQLTQDIAQAEANYRTKSQKATSADYHGFTQNYYYRHTIMEFNYDYVMSMTLFEPKALVTQLIDACVGLGELSAGLTAEEYFVKEEVKKMVTSVLENDDAVVNDCFFAFTNKEYDQMLHTSELRHRGVYVNHNGVTNGASINADRILATLDELSSAATPAGQAKVIRGAFEEISGLINQTPKGSEGSKLGGDFELNFIDNILNNLAYVITCAVISPKFYLLLAINLELIGQDTNFRIEDFIVKFQTLFVSLIRTIRDEILNRLVAQLMEYIGDIVARLSAEFSLETIRYYKRLIKKIIKDCSLSPTGREMDYTQDTIEHADIVQSDNEPPVAECGT